MSIHFVRSFISNLPSIFYFFRLLFCWVFFWRVGFSHYGLMARQTICKKRRKKYVVKKGTRLGAITTTKKVLKNDKTMEKPFVFISMDFCSTSMSYKILRTHPVTELNAIRRFHWILFFLLSNVLDNKFFASAILFDFRAHFFYFSFVDVEFMHK